MTEESTTHCPYCGETITIVVDCSVEDQTYTEDCSVCCKPILFRVECHDGELHRIDPRREG
jgi:hypothetical protein